MSTYLSNVLLALTNVVLLSGLFVLEGLPAQACGALAIVVLSFSVQRQSDWRGRLDRQSWHEELTEVATRLQLDHVQRRWYSYFILPWGHHGLGRAFASGEVGGCPVKIDTFKFESSEVLTRIRVDTGLPSNLTIKNQRQANLVLNKLRRPRYIEAGLETFDDTFFLDGIPEAELLSLLSDRCRAAIWKCIGDDKLPADRPRTTCWVEKGELRLNCTGYMTAPRVLEAVSAMLELGEILKEFSSTAEGLLHHAFEDPEPAFRLRCFSALLEHRASTPEAQEALQRGAASEDPAFLFLVERHKPEPNLDVIAALVRGGDLPSSLKTSGLHMLDSRHAGELSIEAEGGTAGGLSVQPSGEGGLSRAEESERRPRGQKLKS